MRNDISEGTIPDHAIWELVWDTLRGVSDECGQEDLGEGYLLKYEGWGEACVEEACQRLLAQQEDSEGSACKEREETEIEQICCEHAHDQSVLIIDHEWKPALRESGYHFVDGGYCPGGLYGRTWALFRRDD